MWWGWHGIGPMWTGGWLGMVFMTLFWVAVVVGIVLLVRSLSARGGQGSQQLGPPQPPEGGQGAKSEALQILEGRYARGEIDREEFLRRKGDLTS